MLVHRSNTRALLPSWVHSRAPRAAALAGLVALPVACADVPPAPAEGEQVAEARSASSAQVSIVGHVATSGDVALPGISVALNGSIQKTTVTDANGNYIFQVPSGGSYSVNPSRSGGNFSPSVFNFNRITADAIQDFACSGTCSGGPAVVAGKELVITDPSVVNDARTSNAADGPWSFRFMMEQMAPPGSDPADFVDAWLAQFAIPGGTVNGFPVDIRNTAALEADWPKTTDGKLDLSQAPFQLLAIVNRVDLHATGDGEGRFVFGGISNGQVLPITVIFEFGLPATTLTRKAWASMFHALGNDPFGSQYNAALEAITDLFTARNTSPTKPGGSSINQVRTNEFLMTLSPQVWQLREFHLATVNGVLGLQLSPTAQTPTDTANNPGTPENEALVSYLTTSAAEIHGGYASVPSAVIGGQSTESFDWSFSSPVTPQAQNDFAGQTCNGCHSSQPNLSLNFFYQISPLPLVGTDGTGRLSPFVTSFEIPRRTSFLQNVLTCSGATCAAGGEPILQ